jgi:hypothetical protein
MSVGDASSLKKRHINYKNQQNIWICLESVNNKLAGCCGDTPLRCNIENCLIGADQGRTLNVLRFVKKNTCDDSNYKLGGMLTR